MHAENMRGASDLGYLYQLLAMAGWTSLPWLRSLAQPTLVLMGRDDPLVPVINGQILGADPGLARSPRSVTDH